MKRPTFFNGILAALALAFLASVGVTVLAPIFGTGLTVRLVVPALALLYILYLFSRSAERVGRATALVLFMTMTIAAWVFEPPLVLYVLLHAGAVWLVRSLYFYSGVLPALMDFGLTALSVAAAVWAVMHSGSAFLATWCFFLSQALFVAIPSTLNRPGRRRKADAATQRFERARTRAEAAIGQLFTR